MFILQFFGVDEENFDSRPVIQWTQDHAEVPVFFVIAYLGFIFNVPSLLENRKPYQTKWSMGAWNLILAIFSFYGLVNTLPVLLTNLINNGFRYTVCTDPKDWYLTGPVGLYVFLFIYSKIPELVDTVFLVLKKRPVPFIHWFHHCTVLLYCWHAYHNTIAPGLWFAAMNYSVHSVMYAYYMLMTLRLFPGFTKTIAPLITTIQIAQMLVGMTVTFCSAMWYYEDPATCHVTPSNFKLGLGMYTIYFVLFAILFRNLYCSGGKKQKKEFCGVNNETGDAAGHFRGDMSGSKKTE